MAARTRSQTQFRSVETVDEALAVLREMGSDATVLAGGTDVMIQLIRGEHITECLLHIERISGLRSCTTNASGTNLGALLTHRAMINNPDLVKAQPALADACATVGGWQTQEVGTIAGNVCNASPAADTIPPLLVANASIRLASSDADRSLDLKDFVLGRRRTAAEAGELVTSILVEPCTKNTGEAYLKIARRSAMEVSVAGVAVRLSFEDETVSDARIAAGAVAPIPFRCGAAEAILIGSHLQPEAIGEAGAALAGQAVPIDDFRATANYRSRVIRNALARAVETARSRAKQGVAS